MLALALAAVIVLVTALVGLLATSTLAHARAQAAADLAALAAGSRVQRTTLFGADAEELPGLSAGRSPCDLAAAVVDRNGAQLTSCDVGPRGVVSVAVVIRTPVARVTASARAGPRGGPGGDVLRAPGATSPTADGAP